MTRGFCREAALASRRKSASRGNYSARAEFQSGHDFTNEPGGLAALFTFFVQKLGFRTSWWWRRCR